MSKYLIKVVSEVIVDEDELQDFISVREEEWGKDEPEKIEQLKENGNCILVDDKGSTQITILKVIDK